VSREYTDENRNTETLLHWTYHDAATGALIPLGQAVGPDDVQRDAKKGDPGARPDTGGASRRATKCKCGGDDNDGKFCPIKKDFHRSRGGTNRMDELTEGYGRLECVECGEAAEEMPLKAVKGEGTMLMFGFPKSLHIKTGCKPCSLSKRRMIQPKLARDKLPAAGETRLVHNDLFLLRVC